MTTVPTVIGLSLYVLPSRTPVGTHTYTATFVPHDTANHAGSTSNPVGGSASCAGRDDHGMGTVRDTITTGIRRFIDAQHVFFVGTAPPPPTAT